MNSPTGDGCGPKRRLFLKCESHGVYYNPFFNGSRSAGMTEGMRHRESRSGDLGMSIKHLFSFLETRGADPENETLLKVFNDIVGAASEDLGNKHGDSAARLGNEVMIEALDMDGFALR